MDGTDSAPPGVPGGRSGVGEGEDTRESPFADLKRSLVDALVHSRLAGSAGDMTDPLQAHEVAEVMSRAVLPLLDAKDAEIERLAGQASNAVANAIADQATFKSLSVEEGAAVLELGSPRQLVIAWVDAARKMLGDAENYSETRIDFPAASMELKAAGEFDRYVFTVQRAGKLTPHEARMRAEASRRDWAAEAMRLEMELAKLREIALNETALWSTLIVGIGGEHEDPPSNEQIERTVGLWLRHVAREMENPAWHLRVSCGRGDACDQHGAYFRHSDGSPCWGCQICLEEDDAAEEAAAARPVCAVHQEASDA